jgi:2-C-methyl-D-erythritol 4-phosphate cytidylyltransferase
MVSAVVVAAGMGRRFGPASRLPKQFRPLAGKPLLWWTLSVFQSVPAVRHLILVVSGPWRPWAERFIRREKMSKVVAVVEGGAERSDSVRRGLRAVPSGTDIILIHDAARALVSRDIVARVIAAARRTGAALAAWPVPDTVKFSDGGTRVERTLPRTNLWLAQTPQGFRRPLAEKLFRRGGPSFTDDASHAEAAGCPVEIVRGSPFNFKVTVPEDFQMCEAVLKARGRRPRP